MILKSLSPLLPPEHASWCNIWALGGSDVGLPAYHLRLYILLLALLCLWKAICSSTLP